MVSAQVKDPSSGSIEAGVTANSGSLLEVAFELILKPE